MTSQIVLILGGGAVLCYVAVVTWAKGRPRQVLYHPLWSPLLNLVTRHMEATTVFATTFMLQRGTQLSPQGLVHENEHVKQWAAHPFTFLFAYLWQQITKGYRANKFEIAARAAAGEP